MEFHLLEELKPSFFAEGENPLVITSCTASKLGSTKSTTAKAKNMYQGRIVKRTKALADEYDLDWKIISAKYGLLDPEDKIHGYDKKLSSKTDAEKLRPKVIPELKQILPNYSKVLVLAGKHYRQVLDPVADDRFYKIKSEGYGALCSKIKEAISKEN